MDVNPVNAVYQQPKPVPAVTENETKGYSGGEAEISKLNAEITKVEDEIKETMKEVQKATAEDIGGASEKGQLLQSKILMQQQTITIKQMQIKEIESPKELTSDSETTNSGTRFKFDRLIIHGDDAEEFDNVYRLEEKDGMRKIIFNSLKNQESANRPDNKLSDLNEIAHN